MITKCVCGCGNVSVDHAGWYYVPQRDRGGRDAWMCPDCAAHMGRVNGKPDTSGKAIGGGVRYQCVFPMVADSPDMRAYLLKNGFARLHGGYTSPWWRNLNAAKKLCVTLETMRNAGQFELPHSHAPFVAGQWDGYTDSQLAAMIEEFGVDFTNAHLRPNHDGILFDGVRFHSAVEYMTALKQAKALILALTAWFESPTVRRAGKVRELVAWFIDFDNQLPAPGLPC